MGSDASLVALIRLAVHHKGGETLAEPCQCGACWRVERLIRRIVEEEGALRESLAAVLRKHALLGNTWRALAVIERSHAVDPGPVTPTKRSVHQHRSLVFDLCATDLGSMK